MIADVKLYYSSNIVNCTFCKMARDYFESENIEYDDIDIAGNPELRDKLIDITKKDAFPQIKINNYYLVGFKRPVVHALINKIKAQTDAKKENK